MPHLALDELPDDSRVWVFGISPRLDALGSGRVLAQVDRFLESWAAHGAPIVSSRALIDGTFLVVAVDRRSETSGCSIDRMFGLLHALEKELSVKILDPGRIFYRGVDGRIHAVTREEFRRAGDVHTLVFDTLVERLGEIRGGGWEKPASQSWHARLLPHTIA